MISLFIYLYSFVLGYLGTLLDILIPFPVPDALYSVLTIFDSFWYYALAILPHTTIIFGKSLFYSLAFLVALKIFDLMRLPFSLIESYFTRTPSRADFGDISRPISSGYSPPSSDPRGSSGLSNYRPRR